MPVYDDVEMSNRIISFKAYRYYHYGFDKYKEAAPCADMYTYRF